MDMLLNNLHFSHPNILPLLRVFNTKTKVSGGAHPWLDKNQCLALWSLKALEVILRGLKLFSSVWKWFFMGFFYKLLKII